MIFILMGFGRDLRRRIRHAVEVVYLSTDVTGCKSVTDALLPLTLPDVLTTNLMNCVT